MAPNDNAARLYLTLLLPEMTSGLRNGTVERLAITYLSFLWDLRAGNEALCEFYESYRNGLETSVRRTVTRRALWLWEWLWPIPNDGHPNLCRALIPRGPAGL